MCVCVCVCARACVCVCVQACRLKSDEILYMMYRIILAINQSISVMCKHYIAGQCPYIGGKEGSNCTCNTVMKGIKWISCIPSVVIFLYFYYLGLRFAANFVCTISYHTSGQQSRIVPGPSTQSAMSPVNWLEGSPELQGASQGDQQKQIFFPELQPLERVYGHLMGILAQKMHDIEESMRIRVSGLIQHLLRKPMHGVRMGDMPDVPTDSKELYSYIAKRCNCVSPFLIQEVVKIMCIDELSQMWKEYERELAKCLGITLYSGRRKKIPLIEADDLTSMSVKLARNPEQFPVSRVIALRKYFQESVALDIAIFQGYTPSSTVLYFAIPRASVPFMPSLLLSHVAQLKRLEVQKVVVFGYFAVDLEEAQAVALVSTAYRF